MDECPKCSAPIVWVDEDTIRTVAYEPNRNEHGLLDPHVCGLTNKPTTGGEGK